MDFTAEIESKIEIIANNNSHPSALTVILICSIAATIVLLVCFAIYIEDKDKKSVIIGTILAVAIAGIISSSIAINNKKKNIENDIKEILEIISCNEDCSTISTKASKSQTDTFRMDLDITFNYGKSENPMTYTIRSITSRISDAAIDYAQLLNNRKIANNSSEN